MEEIFNTELKQVRLWSHLIVCTFGFLILFYAYLEIQKNVKKDDKGLLYISLAICAWVVDGLRLVVNVAKINQDLDFALGITMSTVNNAFFLIALPYFDHIPKWLSFFQYSKKYIRVIISLSAIVLFVTYFLTCIAKNSNLPDYPDLALTTISTILLAIFLYNDFRIRNLPLLGYLSLFSFFLIFVSQLTIIFKLLENPLGSFIMVLSKTFLITSLCALVASWLFERLKLCSPKDMRLNITVEDDSKIKILLTVLPHAVDREIVISHPDAKRRIESTVHNLLNFAWTRKHKNSEDSWIEYRTKGKFQEYKHIERILSLLNNPMGRKNNVTEIKVNEIFEKRYNGGFLLRVAPENISIDKEGLLRLNQAAKMEGLEYNFDEILGK